MHLLPWLRHIQTASPSKNLSKKKRDDAAKAAQRVQPTPLLHAPRHAVPVDPRADASDNSDEEDVDMEGDPIVRLDRLPRAQP